ncbi:MAG: hypothetical protein K2W96_07260, partial [Gemmataceae bacterium]|nr:hypothetical protein [Gemmataceae bacterium]
SVLMSRFIGTAYGAPSCYTYFRTVPIQLAPKTTAVARTLHADLNCARAYTEAEPRLWVNSVAREACRAAAMVGGVSAAVALCVELARRLGMEAKA